MKRLSFSFFLCLLLTNILTLIANSHREELQDYITQAQRLDTIFTSDYEWNEFIETMNYEACLQEESDEQENILWLSTLLSLLKTYNQLFHLQHLDDLINPFKILNIVRMGAFPATCVLIHSLRSPIPPIFAYNTGDNAMVAATMNVNILNGDPTHPVHVHLEHTTPHAKNLNILFLLSLATSAYTSIEGLIGFYNAIKLPYALKKHLKKPAGIRVMSLLSNEKD